ncbi:hypothetical protein D7X30_09930 [Corallococcus sp. AB011P]|uniref:hypothetical protein n=1 Tax=unclassified Corallococcus TaxID=2685029 RepID=UPI000EA1BAAD|nr:MULTISPECIES: hypothetical protein [unclassified Corallococcus]RKG59380.1 hypothetical protein D7X30_09930 [Corallococcus sp. AB011P]RKH88598.1 hypothetical protein D7Y21_13900 [Corallococcus sp. AB045]
MTYARKNLGSKSFIAGLLLAATALTGCGEDDIKRKYQGTYELDLQLDTGAKVSEGGLDVGFNVYNDDDAFITMNALQCSLSATYRNITEPGAEGGKVEYEDLQDVRPDQIHVCPVPAEFGENLWLDFRLGKGRIENNQLTIDYGGTVVRGTFEEVSNSQGTRVGTFGYTFLGNEVELP